MSDRARVDRSCFEINNRSGAYVVAEAVIDRLTGRFGFTDVVIGFEVTVYPMRKWHSTSGYSHHIPVLG